jgi:iron complex outermembrane receptor protein
MNQLVGGQFAGLAPTDFAFRARRRWVVAAAVCTSLSLGSAFAQQAEQTQTTAQQATGGLEEILVTARYRSENLQQTPIAITALTGVDLEQRQLVNVDDLGSFVPNAYFRTPVSNFGPTETIGLRGITQVDFSYTFEPAVAAYVDDVYHGTETGLSINLLDLERVEVLNGPQGTLFGKNALGGAIRLVTNKPKGDDTASIEGTYGQYHRQEFKAIGDFSLIKDTLFARFVGFSSTQEGFGSYLDFACQMAAQGTPAASGSLPASVSPTQGNGCALGGLGGHNHQAAKVALRYVPTDALEINVGANYSKQADQPYPQALLTPYGNQTTDLFNYLYSTQVVFPKFGINFTASTPGGAGNANFLSPTPYTSYATFGDAVTGQKYDVTQYLTEWGLPVTVDYRIADTMRAKLVLAYESYQSNWINDSDLTPFGLTQTYYQQEHRQYEAEFRLSGEAISDRLDWTAGLFYYNSRDRAYNTTNFDAFAHIGLLGNFVANDGYTDRNKSAFLHGVFKLSDQWSVSAGVRYTNEDKTNSFAHVNQIPTQTIVLANPVDISQSRTDYSGSLNFQATRDMLLYGSVATGFRSPGFNPRIFTPGQLGEVPGEKAIQYEVGNKSDLLEHRLRANTAIFYIDYQSRLTPAGARQCDSPAALNITPYILGGAVCPAGTFFGPGGPGGGVNGTTGLPWFLTVAAPANIRGAEEQLSASPIERLELNFNFGYNEFRSGPSTPGQIGYVNPSVKLQPEFTMSAGVQYAFHVTGAAGTLTPRLDWTHQSYMTNGAITAHQIQPDDIIPGYGLFNLRLTYLPNDAKWSLSAGVTNLFNKFYWEQLGAATTACTPGTSTCSAAGLRPTVARVGTPGVPQQWSVTFSKKF